MHLAKELTKGQPPHSLAVMLDKWLSGKAFRYFRDSTFRRFVSFDALSQIEQNRIFNELVIAGLTLSMLTMEAPDLRANDEQKEYYRKIRNILPITHVSLLKSFGVEQKFLND